MSNFDLGGNWLATDETLPSLTFTKPDFDDSSWKSLGVPSHWHSSVDFSESSGPLLLRRGFSGPTETAVTETRSDHNRRSWLEFDGIFDQASVWLDGTYLGDADGYFLGRAFEVTGPMAAAKDHLLAVELTASSDTGVCGDSPGGLWAPVRIRETGPIRIVRRKVLCSEATPERALISVRAELDAIAAGPVRVRTVVRPATDLRDNVGDNDFYEFSGSTPNRRSLSEMPLVDFEQTQTLASGANRLRWTVLVENPDLWWPWELGEQPLFDVRVEITDAFDGVISDEVTVRMGFRSSARRSQRFSINGQELFLKGTGPRLVGGRLGEIEPREYESALREARTAGLNLVYLERCVEGRDFYRLADELGMLVWQGIPEALDSNPPQPTERYARQVTEFLGHHPSVLSWVRPRRVREFYPALVNGLKRTLDRADSTRPVISAPRTIKSYGSDFASVLGQRTSHLRRTTRVVAFESRSVDVQDCIDVLRLAKTAGVTGFVTNSIDPAVIRGTLDRVRGVCRVMEDLVPGKTGALQLFLLTDLPVPITSAKCLAEVDLGSNLLQWSWEGSAPADSVVPIGTMRFPVPAETDTVSVTVTIESEAGSFESRFSYALPVSRH